MTPLRQRMIDDMTLHGLKPKTIRAYIDCVARFVRHFGKSPELLGTAEIRSYLLYLAHDRHVSASTYNQALCALKFLYRITLGKDWGLDGPARTRRQTKLPVVLSPDEVNRFFAAIPSLRHRAILMTAYAAGLGISEVLALNEVDSFGRWPPGLGERTWAGSSVPIPPRSGPPHRASACIVLVACESRPPCGLGPESTQGNRRL
jgi:integrase/recombinase XerD